MEVFEGVFTKRGEAEAVTCQPTGVFDQVFVKRGRWRKSPASDLQQSSDDVVHLAEHITSAMPTVEYPIPSLSDLDRGAEAADMPNDFEVMQRQRPDDAKLGISDLAQIAVKNTFVNAAILDFDSLKDFLKERKVKSCPASRQVSSVTVLIDDIIGAADANVNSEPKDEMLNTASSFGGMPFTPQKKLIECFNDAIVEAEAVAPEVVLNTASTMMGADFESLQQRISEVSPESGSASRSVPQVFLHTASTLHGDDANEISADDQECLYSSRLSSLRLKGSVIQQHIDQTSHNGNQQISGLDAEAPVCQQPQPPNQWIVAVQTANGVVPGLVTLLGDPQQQHAQQQQQAQPFPTPRNEPAATNASISPAMSMPTQHPPPPVAAPVLRLVDAIAPPELGGADLPSIGSLLHHKGECKPCTFFHTRGCENKENCKFCHLCGPGEKKKRLKQLKAAQREANFAALENAKAILASYSAAEEQGFQVDTIVE